MAVRRRVTTRLTRLVNSIAAPKSANFCQCGGVNGSVAKFLDSRAGSVVLNLFMKLMNKIAVPDEMGHCPAFDLCGSFA